MNIPRKPMICIGLLLCSVTAFADQRLQLEDPGPVNQLIDGLVEAGGAPFLYVRIEDREGRVIYEHGARNADLVPQPVGGDDWVRIWSMSKIVTISLTMDLVEEGLIALDDPVIKYLPELSAVQVATGPDGEDLLSRDDPSSACPLRREAVETPMTVRDLLNHTAGFYYPWTGLPCLDEPFAAADLLAARDSQELIERLAVLPLVFQPGTRDHYGTNTTVLGLVIERATGRSLKQLVAERISGPLGIDGLQYGIPDGATLPPYISGREGKLRPVHDGEMDIFGNRMPGYGEDYPLSLGGEGMVATADAYADFARMLLRRGELNGHRLLEESTVEEIAAPHTQLDNAWGHNGYNLWVSNGRLSDGRRGPAPLWIGGGYEGTHFWIDPQRDFVGVIMTQVFGFPEAGANLHERVRMALYEQLGVTAVEAAAP